MEERSKLYKFRSTGGFKSGELGVKSDKLEVEAKQIKENS